MGKPRIATHTLLATVVLIAAGLWVATGQFTSVGSEAAVVTTGGNGVPAPAAQASETLQTVAYIEAAPKVHERVIRLSGQTEADKRVVLVARTSGAVESLPATEGATLSEGDLAMKLEGEDRLAALASAEAQYELADHQAESDRALAEEGNVSTLRYEASAAAREAARSAVEMARAEAGRLELRAPFDGVVDRVSVEVGSWVQPGTEVATLLALDPIVVTAEIGERDLQWVGPGAAATVVFGDGSSAEGTVRHIRREATPMTRTFPIEIAVPNPGGRIPSGMSADIMLGVPTEPAVVLQRSAITLDTDGAVGVRVLDGEDTAGFLPVDILDDRPDGLVIGGVPEGVKIIVSGQDLVSDGQKVAAVQAPAPEKR